MNNKTYLVSAGVAAAAILLSYLGMGYLNSRKQEEIEKERKAQKKREHQLEEEIKVLEMRQLNDELKVKIEELQKLNPNSFYACYKKLSLLAEDESADSLEKRIKAILEMKKVAKSERDKSLVKFIEQQLELLSGNYDAVEVAQTLILDMLVKYSGDALVLYEAATFYAMVQQFSEVRRLCDNIMALPSATENDTARAQHLRASTLTRPEEREERIAQVKQILSNRPFYVEVLLERAALYLEAGRVTEAMSDIKKSLDVNPKLVSAKTLKAQVLMEQQQYDEVVKECKECIAIKPAFSEAYHILVSVYCSAKRNYDEAMKYATMASEKCDQADLTAQMGKVSVCLAFNKLDECVSLIQDEMAPKAAAPQQQEIVRVLLEFVTDLKAGLENHAELKEIIDKNDPPYTEHLNKEVLRKISIKQAQQTKKTKAEMQSWIEFATVIAYMALAGSPNLSMAFNLVNQFSQLINEMVRSNPNYNFMQYLVNNAYILYTWFAEILRVQDIAAVYWLSEQYLQQTGIIVKKAMQESKDVHQAVIDETAEPDVVDDE